MPHLKIKEVVLIHCNTVNNSYQERVLYTLVPNKLFGQLLDISLEHFHSLNPPPPFLKWRIDLTKNPKKGGGRCVEILLKGRGILRREDAVSLGIFLAGVWQIGHSVPISIECRCQSLFLSYSFSSCL